MKEKEAILEELEEKIEPLEPPPEEEKPKAKTTTKKKKKGPGRPPKEPPPPEPEEVEAEFLLKLFDDVKRRLRGAPLNPAIAEVWRNSYIAWSQKTGISLQTKPEIAFYVSSLLLVVDVLGPERTGSILGRFRDFVKGLLKRFFRK